MNKFEVGMPVRALNESIVSPNTKAYIVKELFVENTETQGVFSIIDSDGKMDYVHGKNLVPYYSENNEQHKLSEEKVQKIIEKSHQLEKLRKEITELFYYNT